MAKREVDFSDEDEVLAVAAEELGEDVDNLKIEESHLSKFGVGTFYEVSTSGGRRSWIVAESDDSARDLALAVVKQDLENEPEIFTQDWLAGFIDKERLARELRSDVESANYDRLSEERESDFWREAARYGMEPLYYVDWDNGHATGRLPGSFENEDEAEQAGEEWKAEMVAADENPEEAEDAYSFEVVAQERDDDAVQTLAEKLTEEQLEDPIAYLTDIYGDEEGMEQAMKIAGFDVDAAAEDAVDTDGWQHFLSRYDSNSMDLPGGLVMWREN